MICLLAYRFINMHAKHSLSLSLSLISAKHSELNLHSHSLTTPSILPLLLTLFPALPTPLPPRFTEKNNNKRFARPFRKKCATVACGATGTNNNNNSKRASANNCPFCCCSPTSPTAVSHGTQHTAAQPANCVMRCACAHTP